MHFRYLRASLIVLVPVLVLAAVPALADHGPGNGDPASFDAVAEHDPGNGTPASPGSVELGPGHGEPAARSAQGPGHGESISAGAAPASGSGSDSGDGMPASPVQVFLIRVASGDVRRDVRYLKDLGLDVSSVDKKAGTLNVVGGPEELDLLRSHGFDAWIERDLTRDESAIAALSDYWGPSEIGAQLDDWVAAYPGLIEKRQYATTEEGRPVWAVKISDNVAIEEDEAAILIVAQHHAREVMTPEIAMDAIEILLTGYGVDPRVTAWVDDLEIWVLPNHNPDGTDYMFDVDSGWRKNRHDNGNGTFGVDLNRNYPYRWGECGGSSGSTSAEDYRGPSPASEPETWQGIQELAREQRPVINLSYHTSGELVIQPYGCAGTYTPENAMFRELASGMAVLLDSDTGTHWYEPGTANELLYPVDGETNDWFYAELGSYGLTVEANASSQGFQPDYATWRDSTVLRNRPGWQYLLDRLEGPSIRGHVTDACTGAPLEAGVSLDEVVFTGGETPRTSEPVHGRYQWLTLPGEFHLRAALDGYHEQVWPVTVGFAAADREIALVPDGSFGLEIRSVVVDDAAGDGDGRADPDEEFRLVVRLVATGGNLTGVTAVLASADPAVTVLDGTATYGAIAAGAEADGEGFTVRLAEEAQDDAAVSFTLTLAADQVLCGESAPSFDLRVTRGFDACPSIVETLDTDPGWTIENNGTGGWEFGPPTAGPTAAYTGTDVYGTNLSGNYGGDGDFYLTTAPFDLRGLRGAELRYARWLSNEPAFDIARVEVSADDGATWHDLWSGFLRGEGWDVHRLDISDLADQEEAVRFRFSLSSDGGTERPGFYVDDVAVCGEEVPSAFGKVKYEGHAVDDSSPDGGNGNGAVDVGETVTVQVDVRSNRDQVSSGVEAFLTTATPGVTVRTGYARFPDVGAGAAATSLAPHFTFTVDGAPCAERIVFDLDVRWDGGQAVSSFVVPVGTPEVAVVLDDDFETDLGWLPGTDATAGDWVREDPYGVTDGGGNPVQPEDDTTADPGVTAWVTANPRPKGNFEPADGDVDDGTVWIDSPTFDGERADRLDLTYNRWFTRKNPATFDNSRFRALVSNDGGSSWVELERVESDAAFWSPGAFDLAQRVEPSASMRLRFEAAELVQFGTGDPLIEGLVDDVFVERERRECDPYDPPVRQAPNAVGGTLRADRSGPHLRLDWQAPPVDAGHDAATSYVVYRSAAPAAGFGVESTPTAEFAVYADELLVGSTGYFLVVAENAGGSSGDEPAP